MKVFIPATLGMLTAFGPFVTDFYLPVLPEMTGYFHTTPALASMSLTAGMIGLAFGQLFIGPLTDKYGRKRILVGSMLLFVVASLLCIFSGDIFMFNAMRVLQGLAGAGGIVIAKSMSADMYTGRELASFMALLGAINGIAPVCAPVVGGLMAGVTSWTGVFAVILAVGLVLMVCSMFLPETLQPANRIRKSVIKVYGNLFRVFRNSRFTLSVMAEMACFFMFFAYIASSPFIMQQVYHLSPLGYSLCFGLNALMIGVGAAMATRFRSQGTCLRFGGLGMLAGTLLLAFLLNTAMPLWIVMLAYIYTLICFGLMQPPLTAIALDSERDNAGAASAIFGASGFVAGALSSPLVGIGDITVTSGLVMVCGAVVCLLFILPLSSKLRAVAA
ncbi:multidrug effflux MFS transporter [Xylanibacter rarus]|uniref:multidrug effflux MFS transporter n=1 Tax=Xylanibacter rarus TaxID=1676614 RepID=UPI003FD7F7B6